MGPYLRGQSFSIFTFAFGTEEALERESVKSSLAYGPN